VRELAVSDPNEIDPVDRKALAGSVDEHCRPLERGFVAIGDVSDDCDLEAREVISHAFIESPDLIVANQGACHGMKDRVAVEVRQHAFNVPPLLGSPIRFADRSRSSHEFTISFTY
jgi:hypothetical protein